jgi:hypothetical protein
METALAPLFPVVPEESREVTVDLSTLAAAFKLAYLAGRGDANAEHETLDFLRRTIRNMQRSLRRPRPTPQAGVEAGLDLLLAAVDTRLDAGRLHSVR